MIQWKSDESETVFYNFGAKTKRPTLYARDANRNVFKDLPESGGGASSGATDGTDVAASDDDGGGGDDDPDPDRRRSLKNTTPSFAPALFSCTTLARYIAFGRSRIYALIQQGKFPPPIKVGKSSRWVKTEVDAWLGTHMAARDVFDAIKGHSNV